MELWKKDSPPALRTVEVDVPADGSCVFWAVAYLSINLMRRTSKNITKCGYQKIREFK
jgi:hypothetical protein